MKLKYLFVFSSIAFLLLLGCISSPQGSINCASIFDTTSQYIVFGLDGSFSLSDSQLLSNWTNHYSGAAWNANRMNCKKGSEQGENVNYYYCSKPIVVERTIQSIDSSGTILKRETQYASITSIVYQLTGGKDNRENPAVKIINASCQRN